MFRRGSWRHLRLGSVVAAAVVATAGAASVSSAGVAAPEQSERTLVLGHSRPYATLNPLALNNGTPQAWFVPLAYSSLFRRTSLPAPRTYQPDLARSWKYSRNNRVFTIQLRRGVVFADGAPVNAQAVVRSLLNWRRTPNVSGQTWGSSIARIRAIGTHTVRLSLNRPDPDMPFVLSHFVTQSPIISPRGLADQSKLGSQMFGSGPYILDESRTLLGQTLTFVKNPRYYDKSKQHWDTVIIRTLPNENSAFSALRAGQVDLIAIASESVLTAASNSGFRLAFYPTGNYGIMIGDRRGVRVPALRDVRVRRALNQAIDRKTIIQATFGKFGQPNSQPGAPVEPDTFDPALEKTYPFNPARAKQLMTQAGYANGFRAQLLVNPAVAALGNAIQAVTQQWKQHLNVDVEIVRSTSGAQFLGQVVSGQYGLSSYTAGTRGWNLAEAQWNGSEKNGFNPFGLTDPVVTRLVTQMRNAKTQKEAIALGRQITKRFVDQAYQVALVRAGQGYAYSNKLQTIRLSGANSQPDVAWFVRPR
jgi:peptide/nickel transport system substrate-binding protein